jgi:hypothetical protein
MIDLNRFRLRSESILAARNAARAANPIPHVATEPKSNGEAWKRNPALVIARQVRERLYQATIPDNVATGVFVRKDVG